MQCVHDGAVAAAPDRLARLADLVVDPRWLHRFKVLQTGTIPTMEPARARPGPIPAPQLRGVALDVLASPSTESVLFGVSRKETLNHASFDVEVGRRAVYGGACPHSANASWRAPDDTTTETMAAAWVGLQHDLIETLGAAHGVLVTATNRWVLLAETWLSVTSLDGKLMHPDPEEISSYSVQRDKLGDSYIRKPRWGTYLKPAHVAAAGGRDKLLAVVQPPVVRDVGELLYVQLSERVADATAPETRARYRAFVELVAPITMPRRRDAQAPDRE